MCSVALGLVVAACGGSVVLGDGSHDSGVKTSSEGGGDGGGGGTTSEGGTSTAAPVAEPKVDLLFDIDNSASMGDKQAYLIQAIPEMIARLVTPQCLDNATKQPTGTNADPTNGACATGSTPEFQPVHDMHIGVVTSSLGPRLGVAANGTGGGASSPVCDPALTVMSQAGTSVNAYEDDKGHLINRTGPFGSGAALSVATLPEGGGFLNWYPVLDNNAITPVTPPGILTTIGNPGIDDTDTLVGAFTELVGGAGESGCGIESQLESWYRFLIQPDPYDSLATVGAKATWVGVDTTIIQQRHDFLRPDSLVAVIVLSDENDSEIDVRSYSGLGYLFMSNTYSPPRGTSACASNPNSADCTSCPPASACAGASPPATCSDPACKVNGGVYSSTNDGADWGYNLNLRHVRMQAKYGLNPTPQFPLTRYYNGLTSPTVPNRIGEYPTTTTLSYTGTNNCTNPLFAASLPQASDVPDGTAQTPLEITTTLCNLPAGTTRNASDVFYAHIGGVPHQLLQSTPGDGTCPAGTAAADCPQKATLAASDWVKILGQGPAGYTGAGGTTSFDYTGIDPHMIESMTPRNVSGLPNSFPAPASNPAVSSLSGPALGTGTDPVRPDPINGREWTTYTGVHSLPVDREFACIFPLPLGSQRDCATLSESSIEANSCDCDPGGSWSTGGTAGPTQNSPDEIPPICSKTSTDGTSIVSAVSDYTVQTHAKVYPTIRELTLANMLGAQGVVSSMCPIHTEDNAAGDDPLYGYRPAMDVLVSRMKPALAPAM